MSDDMHHMSTCICERCMAFCKECELEEERFYEAMLDKMIELANSNKKELGKREPGEKCKYEG